ncbi:hypothetical protein GCM10022291_08840 [Postechiella marina]|uniref:DUF2383 domain-containing protein n=1 Tax=Postechiella marina TaxID=943941 RepID=A0ABP8C458_9FLAO
MGVKRYDRILIKLNDLFVMNHQLEETFAKVQDNVEDRNLQSFVKQKIIERNQFGESLENELKKLETKTNNSLVLARRNGLKKFNFKRLLNFNDDIDLLKQVYKMMQLSVKKYNELLMEMHLPLSLCKLLIKQRDRIQNSLEVMQRETAIAIT